VQQGGRNRVVLFCSFGSPTSHPVSYKPGTPPILDPCARVSLRPHNRYHDDHGPIGLSFTHEEYEQVLMRFCGPDGEIHLDRELQDILFDWTAGHAGAVVDLLDRISYQVREFQ